VLYRLNLSIELKHVHNIFHISQVQKYVPDPNHIIEPEPIEIAKNLPYDKHHVQILDCRFKQLHNKNIPPVKVLWANHTFSEATWETEQDTKSKYPYLFEQVL